MPPLKSFTNTVDAPPSEAFAVAPDDEADLDKVPRALYIGVSGDVTVRFADKPEDNILFKNVPVGLFYGQFTRVLATGTTATDIVALV